MPTHMCVKQTQLSWKSVTADTMYYQQPILSPNYTAHCFTITHQLKSLPSCKMPLKG